MKDEYIFQIKTILFFLLLSSISLAQQKKDTIYYDKQWYTTTKNKAVYFRVLPLMEKNELYEVKDYYINGQIQMNAYSSSKENDVFEGKATWYFSNGKKQIERYYKNGSPEGVEISYYKDGKVKTKGEYKDGDRIRGTFLLDDCSYPYNVEKYENYKIKERYLYYENSKTIAAHQFLKNRYNTDQIVYYDNKGKQIEEVIFSDKEFDEDRNYSVPKTIVHIAYSSDCYAKEIIGKTIYSELNGEKQEKTFDKKGKLIAVGTYKNNLPFQGTFYKNGKLTTYSENQKIKETCCLDNTMINTNGTFENDIPYNGSFFNKVHKTLSTYKNGVLNGEKITYDHNNEIEKLITYKNGLLEGKKITRNPATHEQHMCIYKNDKPYEGEIASTYSVKKFKEGKNRKTSFYDLDTGALEKEEFYSEKEFITDSIITYENNKKYKITYKDGFPYEGIDYDFNDLKTYRNGEVTGPFVLHRTPYLVVGNYKKFEFDGEILFIKQKDTLKCTYINGAPLDGVDALNGYIEYKNGKKEGLFSKNLNYAVYDSLTVYYKKDIPVGEINYYKEGEKIASGTYKEGAPYNGTFFENDKTNSDNKTVYKQGIVLEKEVNDIYNNYKKISLYKNNELSEEYVYKYNSNELMFSLEFKQGRPFSGDYFRKDPHSNLFVVTHFENGKKSGLETYTKRRHREKKQRQYTYKNGVLNGKSSYFDAKETIEGYYQKGKPYDGNLVTLNAKFMSIDQYHKGTIQQSSFFNFNHYSGKKDSISSLTYRKGKPYHGLLPFIIQKNEKKPLNDKIIIKEYKRGTHIGTYINPYLKEFKSSPYILHLKEKDSLPADNNEGFVIEYNDAKKHSGQATYYDSENKKTGYIRFQNHKIVEIKINPITTSLAHERTFFISEDGNYLIDQIKKGDFIGQQKIPNSLKDPLYYTLSSVKKLSDLIEIATLTFFLRDFKNPLCSGTLKHGRMYDGTFIFPDNEATTTYAISIYKDGKKIEKKLGLSEEELMNTIKQYRE